MRQTDNRIGGEREDGCWLYKPTRDIEIIFEFGIIAQRGRDGQ